MTRTTLDESDNALTDRSLEKLSTIIPGLDRILHGGLPRGGIYIIQGRPGCGKTILGNQLCFSHAERGGRALYVTLLAETHGRMLGNISQFSFFNEGAIPDKVSYLSAFRILETEGLKGLTDALRREIRARKVDLLVLDGLVSAEETAGTPREFKKFINELQIQADLADCTMVLLTSAAADQGFASSEHTMVDGLIELQKTAHHRRSERHLQVHKLRGSDFIGGIHTVRITAEGVIVHPRIESMLVPVTGEGRETEITPSGVLMLDEMIGGGISRRSMTMIMGSAGTGKTSFALHFLAAEEEPGIYLTFNETPLSIRLKASSFNLPAEDLIERGVVEIMWRPSTEALLDEVCDTLLQKVRERGIRRVVIDGLDDFGRMSGDDQRVGPALTALSNNLAALGATTLATSEIDLNTARPGQPLAGLTVRGLSPFAENIIVLQHAALHSSVHRIVLALKVREHSIRRGFRLYQISERGIEIDTDTRRANTILSQIARRQFVEDSDADLPPHPGLGDTQ
jgi:circadian clock protein KaiC